MTKNYCELCKPYDGPERRVNPSREYNRKEKRNPSICVSCLEDLQFLGVQAFPKRTDATDRIDAEIFEIKDNPLEEILPKFEEDVRRGFAYLETAEARTRLDGDNRREIKLYFKSTNGSLKEVLENIKRVSRTALLIAVKH